MSTFALQKQQGFTLIGMITWATVVIILAVIGLKFFPIAYEHYMLRSAIDAATAIKPNSPADTRDAFNKFAKMNDLRAITDSDITVIASNNGEYVIEYDYTRQVPINDWMRVVMDFKGSSADKK